MEENKQQELAKLKRKAVEIASAIHDIVEDRLMTDYNDLKPLSEQAIAAVEKFHAYKKENSL
ncbi:MAG: hypothetical protein RL154_1055 [Pseudomonadota bacterium]|jgi:hypothetical protein